MPAPEIPSPIVCRSHYSIIFFGRGGASPLTTREYAKECYDGGISVVIWLNRLDLTEEGPNCNATSIDVSHGLGLVAQEAQDGCSTQESLDARGCLCVYPGQVFRNIITCSKLLPCKCSQGIHDSRETRGKASHKLHRDKKGSQLPDGGWLLNIGYGPDPIFSDFNTFP